MQAAASLVNTLARPTSMETAVASSALRELTTGLSRGDDAAWAQFHREYGPGIFRRLLAATRGDHDLASEALQQTYLRIARHARPCDVAPMFAGWLRVVSQSALSDCRRRRSTFWDLLRNRDAAPEPGSDATHTTDAALSSALEHALARISESERALLERKYFAGIAVRTIAAQLGITEKAVESRLTRARAELRRELTAALKRHE